MHQDLYHQGLHNYCFGIWICVKNMTLQYFIPGPGGPAPRKLFNLAKKSALFLSGSSTFLAGAIAFGATGAAGAGMGMFKALSFSSNLVLNSELKNVSDLPSADLAMFSYHFLTVSTLYKQLMPL